MRVKDMPNVSKYLEMADLEFNLELSGDKRHTEIRKRMQSIYEAALEEALPIYWNTPQLDLDKDMREFLGDYCHWRNKIQTKPTHIGSWLWNEYYTFYLPHWKASPYFAWLERNGKTTWI